MTTGKDDLTKKSQLGSKLGYPGCPECKPGDGTRPAVVWCAYQDRGQWHGTVTSGGSAASARWRVGGNGPCV